MKSIKALSLRVKLVLCVSFLSAVTLLVGIVGETSIAATADRGAKIYNDGVLPLLYLEGVQQTFQETEKYYLHVAYGGKSADLNKIEGKLYENAEYIEAYGTHVFGSDEEALYKNMKETFQSYRSTVSQAINDIALNNVNSRMTIDQVLTEAEAAQAALNTLIEIRTTSVAERADENIFKGKVARTTLNIIMVVGIIVSLIIVLLIIKTLTKQINQVVKGVEQVAVGDLDVQLSIEDGSEIGQLATNFNKMVQSIREVVMNIESASEQVHMGAKQVAHTSSLLAQGATEQASTVEELTAAVEQINVQIKQNADHSQAMNAIAVNTKAVVEKSHNEMAQMLRAMEDINHSSSEISKIIKVIDDIAFQTNILALNAAVEAARAGQHGKGFTVVAEEVRNLAAKSAEAAKETTSMIESSIKNAQVGMELAQGAAEELGHVVEGISEVVQLTGEISTSCTEQSIGIGQINENALQISNVIQSNSATSQESAAASEELAGQAELMRMEVSRFSIHKGYKVQTNYSLSHEENHSFQLSDNDFGKY